MSPNIIQHSKSFFKKKSVKYTKKGVKKGVKRCKYMVELWV